MAELLQSAQVAPLTRDGRAGVTAGTTTTTTRGQTQRGGAVTHHRLGVVVHKVSQRLRHLLSAFGPLEVCVAFSVGLLNRNHKEARSTD